MGRPLNLPTHLRLRYADARLWKQLLNDMAHVLPGRKTDPALQVRYRAALEDRADPRPPRRCRKTHMDSAP